MLKIHTLAISSLVSNCCEFLNILGNILGRRCPMDPGGASMMGGIHFRTSSRSRRGLSSSVDNKRRIYSAVDISHQPSEWIRGVGTCRKETVRTLILVLLFIWPIRPLTTWQYNRALFCLCVSSEFSRKNSLSTKLWILLPPLCNHVNLHLLKERSSPLPLCLSHPLLSTIAFIQCRTERGWRWEWIVCQLSLVLAAIVRHWNAYCFLYQRTGIIIKDFFNHLRDSFNKTCHF